MSSWSILSILSKHIGPFHWCVLNITYVHCMSVQKILYKSYRKSHRAWGAQLSHVSFMLCMIPGLNKACLAFLCYFVVACLLVLVLWGPALVSCLTLVTLHCLKPTQNYAVSTAQTQVQMPTMLHIQYIQYIIYSWCIVSPHLCIPYRMIDHVSFSSILLAILLYGKCVTLFL